MDLFTYLLGKKGQNTQKDLFSYLLGKKASTSGTYTTYTGQTFNIANTVRAKIKKWILGGNTEQDIEPTPDNPQEIHIVRANNNIKIENKNLFNPALLSQQENYNTFDEETGLWTTSDIGGYSRSILYGVIGYNSDRDITKLIKLGIGTYTIKFFDFINNTDSVNSLEYAFYDSTGTYISRALINNGLATFTTSSEIYLDIRRYGASGTVSFSSIQIEQGSTATEYTPHQEQNYPINLPIENLFDVSLLPITKNGVTLSFDNDGNLVLNGTPDITSGYINFIPSPNVTLKPNTYTISMNEIKDGIGIYFGNIGASQINMGDLIKERTFTINQTETGTFGINVRYNIGTLTNYTLNAQLEAGTIAHSYNKFGIPALELCKIGDYQDEIKVSDGTNLFDKNNANILIAYFASPAKKITTSQNAKMFYISCKPNTTYTISKIASERFRVMTTETIPEINVIGIDYAQNEAGTRITITTSSNAHYLCVYYFLNGTDTLSEQEILDSIQVEYGSQVTEYQPYGIGTWYIKKNIGKSILNGTEEGFNYLNGIFYSSDYLQNNPYISNQNMFCNYFQYGGTAINTTSAYEKGNNKICNHSLGKIIYFRNDNLTSLEEWQNWLIQNNVTFYYVLSKPIYTVITDTNLISQLNALLNSRSYNEQTNISQTNNDLPFNISLDIKVTSANLGMNLLNNSFLSNKIIIEDENIEQTEIENQIYSEGE